MLNSTQHVTHLPILNIYKQNKTQLLRGLKQEKTFVFSILVLWAVEMLCPIQLSIQKSFITLGPGGFVYFALTFICDFSSFSSS